MAGNPLLPIGKPKPTQRSLVPKTGSTMVQGKTTYVFDGHNWNAQPNHIPGTTPAPPGNKTANPVGVDEHITGMQKFLKAKGYNIKVSGTMDRLTQKAAADWRGQRNPDLWNHSYAPQGKPVSPGGSKPGGGPGGAGGGTIPTGATGLTKLSPLPDPNVNQTIDQGIANTGASMIAPGYADQVAGLQFDPQISDTKMQIQRNPLDLQQHLHDISNWYGTVDKALGTAKDRNAALTKDTTGAIGNITQGILASMGGSAALGSGMVGAQGAADAATQAQLGQNEQSYQNDLAPLIQGEAAGAKQNESAKATAQAQVLAQTLASLQGQRGQAKGAAMLDITKANNATADDRRTALLQILQGNNAVRQQNLTNAQQAQSLALAAAMNNAQIKAYGSAGTTPFVPWMSMNPAQRQSLINAGVSNVMDPSGGLLGNPQQARGKVLQYLGSQGYNSAMQPGSAAYNSMAGLIDLAIQHAQAIGQKNAAVQAAANG